MGGKFVLGIDGGGTKTLFLLTDLDGHMISEAKTGCLDFRRIEGAGVFETIETTARDMLSPLGAELGDVAAVCAGIPRIGEYRNWRARCLDAVRGIFQNAWVECLNDVNIGLFGSLALAPGIHLVAGTGAMGVGRDASGQWGRCGGWSEFNSDEGSGYWLGCKACELFYKQMDGRISESLFFSLIKQTLRLEKAEDFIAFSDESLLGNRSKTASLQLVLKQAAEQGDPHALQLYRDAAYELSLYVTALLRTMSFTGVTKVSYSGGVFGCGALILEPLAQRLQQYAIELVPPALSPVHGAAMAALCIGLGKDLASTVAHLKQST